MGFESDGEGNEIWTCDSCGFSVLLHGEGGDVAECPDCVAREQQWEEEEEYCDWAEENYGIQAEDDGEAR